MNCFELPTQTTIPLHRGAGGGWVGGGGVEGPPVFILDTIPHPREDYISCHRTAE